MLRFAKAEDEGDQDGRNAFASADGVLSRTGEQFVAGLIEHALPMTVFATPTVNGYKRYRPYSFAPDRVCWAVENRGALIGFGLGTLSARYFPTIAGSLAFPALAVGVLLLLYSAKRALALRLKVGQRRA